LEDLADLPLQPLLAAIEHWRRHGTAFFPQIPELRGLVNPRPSEEAEAEHAWQEVVRWTKKYYHPDRGVQGRWNAEKCGYDPVPRLDGRSQQALRSVGGVHAVWSVIDLGEGCSQNYGWVRRDFVSAWKLAPEVERAALAAGSDDKKLLGQIKALAEAKEDGEKAS
jgi:hypothetical protein